MNVRYRVELSQAERCELTAVLSKDEQAARKRKHAQILLAVTQAAAIKRLRATTPDRGSNGPRHRV